MSGSRFFFNITVNVISFSLCQIWFLFSFCQEKQLHSYKRARQRRLSRRFLSEFLVALLHSFCRLIRSRFPPFFSLWCTCISINSCRLGIWQERRCLRRADNTAATHTSAFYSCPNTTRRGKFGSYVCARFCLRVLAVMRLNKITNKRKIQRKDRANTQMAHEFVSVLRRSGCDCDGTVLMLLMCCAAANPTKVIHTDTKQLSCQSLETTAQIPGRALPCS